MSLLRLLLVDDSEAMLAYERAALGGYYELAVARDGIEALGLLRSALPEAVLLDLSMPRMNGEQVLEAMRDDVALRAVPVIVVSSEAERARALGDKIAAFVKKPVEGASLRATVERVLDDARRARERGGLAALRVDVGGVELALPLAHVRQVVAQPSCDAIVDGPSFVREVFTLEHELVPVVELAELCGIAARSRYVDRSLVVLQGCRVPLALAVDRVRHPEVVPAHDVLSEANAANATGRTALLRSSIRGAVRVAEVEIPLVDPTALLSDEVWTALALAVAPVVAPAAEPAPKPTGAP